MMTDRESTQTNLFDTVPPLFVGDGPFQSSDEHLWYELQRVDLLLRAQVQRWHVSLGSHKSAHLWGMSHVTEQEIATYLQTPFADYYGVAQPLRETLAPFWEQAEELAQSIARRLEQTNAVAHLRLQRLQTLFQLSPLERDVMLLCLLPEIEVRYGRLIGYLRDDATQTHPSVALLRQILLPYGGETTAGRQMFAATAPLRQQQLVQVDCQGQPNLSLPFCTVRLDPRIVAYLLGEQGIDGRLATMATLSDQEVRWEEIVLPDEPLTRLQGLADWWSNDERAEGATFLFHGGYGSGRGQAARAFCTTTATPLLVVDVVQALRAPEGWGQVVKLVYREAVLGNSEATTAVYWANCEQLRAREQPDHLWEMLLAAAEASSGLTFLATETAWEPAQQFHQQPFIRFEFPLPSYNLRCRLWQKGLEPHQNSLPDWEMLAQSLANGFQLTAGQIADALATAWRLAHERTPQAPKLTAHDLYTGCRRQSGRHLVTMARRIEPRTTLTFDDLILPPQNKRQLQEMLQRIQHQGSVFASFESRLSLGKGLIALFSGSSGTGKTMAAELLARELGVDLYKVDLSAVVSKYVGETEKNLNRIFAEAEDANAIIFFDEADALFGKRGEVKESKDRWANMEVNFLLQRVEEYAGTVIMTSNLRQNIDSAFLRRIHIIVEFPFPDAQARYHIWRGVFPTGFTQPAEDEIAFVAERFKLAGGSIKNIIVDAAFRVLAEDPDSRHITLRHLLIAVAREYQKLGLPITPSEFGQEGFGWIEAAIL